MKVLFKVSTGIKSGSSSGIQHIQTDLLLITMLSGGDPGADFKAVDLSLNGLISQNIRRKKFNAEIGEKMHIRPVETARQSQLAVYGLGNPQDYDLKVLSQIVVDFTTKAIASGANHIAIPVVANRVTSGQVSLKSTGVAIAKAVADTLKDSRKARESARELTVEIVCTTQAARHLRAGINCVVSQKSLSAVVVQM